MSKHNKEISLKLTENTLVEEIAVKFGKFVCANMEVDTHEDFLRGVYKNSFKDKYKASLDKE